MSCITNWLLWLEMFIILLNDQLVLLEILSCGNSCNGKIEWGNQQVLTCDIGHEFNL